MKTRPNRRRQRGFTLVELLVVISIIIVLAAMSFGGIQIAQKKTKNLQAKTDVTALATAIDRYYSEYSKLPDVGMQGDEMTTEGEVGIELLTILLGKEETGTTMQNPRQIPFLNVREGKTKKNGGLIYSSNNQVEGLFDPWGKAYNLRFDDDFDDEIKDPIKQGGIVRKKIVLVYSYGSDGKIGKDDEQKNW